MPSMKATPASTHNLSFHFSYLPPFFVQPNRRVGQILFMVRSARHGVDRIIGELRLVRVGRVAANFLEGLVPRDGGGPVRAVAGLCRASRSSLPQPRDRAMREHARVELLPEPISETRRRVSRAR